MDYTIRWNLLYGIDFSNISLYSFKLLHHRMVFVIRPFCSQKTCHQNVENSTIQKMSESIVYVNVT